MSMDDRFIRPPGVLTIFVSLPLSEAGLMAAHAFFDEGDHLRTFLGSLASLGAFLLLGAGMLLCVRRRIRRRVAYWGAAASIVACTVGALIGLVGGHGVLYGVGYPIVIVLLLRATPSSGLPSDARAPDSPPHTANDDQAVLRSVLAWVL